jgi:hypothetical protein
VESPWTLHRDGEDTGAAHLAGCATNPTLELGQDGAENPSQLIPRAVLSSRFPLCSNPISIQTRLTLASEKRVLAPTLSTCCVLIARHKESPILTDCYRIHVRCVCVECAGGSSPTIPSADSAIASDTCLTDQPTNQRLHNVYDTLARSIDSMNPRSLQDYCRLSALFTVTGHGTPLCTPL